MSGFFVSSPAPADADIIERTVSATAVNTMVNLFTIPAGRGFKGNIVISGRIENPAGGGAAKRTELACLLIRDSDGLALGAVAILDLVAPQSLSGSVMGSKDSGSQIVNLTLWAPSNSARRLHYAIFIGNADQSSCSIVGQLI